MINTIGASSDLQKALATTDDVIALQLISRVLLFAMTHNVNPLAMRNAIDIVLNGRNYDDTDVKAYAEAGKHWNL